MTRPLPQPETRRHLDGPLSPVSVTLPSSPRAGSRGPARPAAGSSLTFEDVDRRAERLIAWAAEEKSYLQRRDVRLFRHEDVVGRTGFADESLYELLPQLHADAALLRLACGRGPMWSTTRELCDRASAAVQDYYRVWAQLRGRRDASTTAVRFESN